MVEHKQMLGCSLQQDDQELFINQWIPSENRTALAVCRRAGSHTAVVHNRW